MTAKSTRPTTTGGVTKASRNEMIRRIVGNDGCLEEVQNA